MSGGVTLGRGRLTIYIYTHVLSHLNTLEVKADHEKIIVPNCWMMRISAFFLNSRPGELPYFFSWSSLDFEGAGLTWEDFLV